MPISANHNKFVDSQYISALPADDLINLAVKKQEMYTEGLTKVQQSVDAYGQLRNNIKTDVEREYFDKTMDNLVKTINSSAGLDFSMKGNVQAVLNIGKPLEKDEYITTAISNGKEITRRQETLGKLKSDERSAANDADYFEDVQDYMKSGKLGYKLGSKEYTPYIDISKEINERMKSAKENGTVDIIMDGKYIKTESTKGLTNDQVAAKIRAGLGGKEYNQLRIDAMYDLKQRGVEQGHAEVVNYYSNLKQTSEAILLQSQNNLKVAQDAYAKTPTESARLDLEAVRGPLEEARVQVEVANKNLTKVSDPANFNPNQYVNLFTDKFISNQSNAYVYKQVEAKIEADPYGTIEANSRKAMNLAAYNSQLRMQENEQKSNLASAKLPADARVISGQDVYDLGGDPTKLMDAIVQNSSKADPKIGTDITEAKALLEKAAISTNQGRADIQKAITSLRASYNTLLEDHDVQDKALDGFIRKTQAILSGYNNYENKLAAKDSKFKKGEFQEVNYGKGTMPVDEYFKLPFMQLLQSDQTQIYSRAQRSTSTNDWMNSMPIDNPPTTP
jgi:hypothetical protein